MERRVLLADQHDHLLWALRTALREEAGLFVVGEALDAASLITQAQSLRPDLIVLEWELPDLPPEELLSILGSLDPRPLIIVLSRCSEPRLGERALASGADAFLSKVQEPEELLRALRELTLPDVS